MADETPLVAAASPSAPEAVAGGPGSGSASPAGSATPASVSVPLFGGFKGGRPRKDGLKPGSPEALEADRAKDAERKRRVRERQQAAAAATPPPLPSASPALAGAAAPPAADLGALPGLAGDSPLPWDPKMLQPLFEQLTPTAEEMAITQITDRAKRLGLPAELMEEIERDSRWNAAAKKTINYSGPQLCAKWLNKSGVSAENQPEVVFGTAVCSLVIGHIMVLRRLDKLIRQNAGSVPQAAEQKS